MFNRELGQGRFTQSSIWTSRGNYVGGERAAVSISQVSWALMDPQKRTRFSQAFKGDEAGSGVALQVPLSLDGTVSWDQGSLALWGAFISAPRLRGSV